MAYHPPVEVARCKSEWLKQLQDGKTVLCGICNDPIKWIPKGGGRKATYKLWGLTVDHIIPKALGGTNDEKNLQPSHLKCNSDKGHKDWRQRIMSERICLLKDIRVVLADGEYSGVYECDINGMETGEPERKATSDKRYRLYHCLNCGKREDGNGEFTMREHLGRKHPMLDPFPA